MVSDPTDGTDPDLERRVSAARDLAATVEQASASEVAEDHTLTVTVSAGNALTDLELTRQALRHDSGTLATLIIDTASRAADRLREELRDAATRSGAADPDVVDLFGGALPEPGSDDARDGPDEGEPELDALLEEAERAPMPSAWEGRVPQDTFDPRAPFGADDEEQADDGPMAALRALQRTARQQTIRYAEIHDELRTMTATGSSAEDLVTATVGHGNVLHGLEFAPAAFRHGPKRVASFVLTAVQQASAALSERIAERLADGVEPPLDIRSLVARYRPDEAEPTEGLSPSSKSSDHPHLRSTDGWKPIDEGT